MKKSDQQDTVTYLPRWKKRGARPIDLTGKRFGRLIAISVASHAPIKWLLKCDCGNSTEQPPGDLKNGNVSSCGCLHLESITKHGKTGMKEYRTWQAMIQRCTNPKHKGFNNYGGRGIKVCDKWMDFTSFYNDMGDAPKGFTIERKDNNLGYSPGNCIWADYFTQLANRRNTRFLTVDKETKPLSQWARESGLEYRTLLCRIQAGWPAKMAVSLPSDKTYQPMGKSHLRK